MLERIWESVQVVGGSVLTLFLLMAVGFALGKWGLLTGQTLSQTSQLLLRVVTPAIIIDSFDMERTPALDRQLLTAGVALAGTYALYMLLSTVMFRRRDPDERGILRFASIYGNKGFMGLPLIQAALGSQATMVAALALAILSGCPVAGATSLFSQTMGKDTGLAARLVSLSTLLSILTLPLVAVVAGQVAGV